jgi:hypothetical protein
MEQCAGGSLRVVATIPKLCLVIIIAQAFEAVGVRDDESRFMYPVREASGKKLVSLIDTTPANATSSSTITILWTY